MLDEVRSRYERSVDEVVKSVIGGFIVGVCRNMFDHVLVGRPAARLEAMALVICSHVLDLNLDQRR